MNVRETRSAYCKKTVISYNSYNSHYSVFSVFIPSVHFDSNLGHFMPENDVMKAQEKVNNYFGEGYSVHMIYAFSDNVLDAESLREEYAITENATRINGVEEVISFVGIIDACRVDFEDMSC